MIPRLLFLLLPAAAAEVTCRPVKPKTDGATALAVQQQRSRVRELPSARIGASMLACDLSELGAEAERVLAAGAVRSHPALEPAS